MQEELTSGQIVDEAADLQLEEVSILVEEEVFDAQISVDQYDVIVEESEIIEIDVSEGFTGNTSLKVSADHSRYLPNQHTIGAITGLREELDELERLKAVYSDEKNQANYYLWEDENPTKENRNGYFVAVRKDDNRIRICASTEDEFGVTVGSAGLIGGQSESGRNESYGLVVHSGVVGVRCETDVEANDYVVSDDYGVAKKTDGTYGYLVTAISVVDGVNYAIISLTMPSTQMQKFSEITQDVQDRMEEAEINIATAISVANAAYNKAKGAEDSVNAGNQIVGEQVSDILGRVEDVENQIDDLGGTVGSASQMAAEAYNISNTAASIAENIRKEAVESANNAQASVNDLINDLAPITTWVDPESGNKGADYLVTHINNNLATKTEVAAVETLSENNMTAISQNAENIELLAMSIDKYSVGEWSQAYGLTWGQAKSILKKDMLYIPTVEHDEIYEGYPTDDNKHEFTRGYYYIWNGSCWVESGAPFVYFSSEYVYPSEQCEYWYRETDEDLERPNDVTGDMETYEANALYVWTDDKWTKVNILDGNVTNRVVSAIKQTANQIQIDVANARGDIAALEAKVDAGGATTAMMASVVTQFKDSEGNQINITGEPYASADGIVGESGKYYAVGESAPYDVYTLVNGELTKITYLYYDGVEIKQPNTASIVAAVNNDGDSSVGINADKIIMTGTTTFLRPLDVGPNGSTEIDGARIRTGAVQSHDYIAGQRGFQINLTNNTISSPNFQLDQYGNVNMAGRITATSGYIAGFAIDHNGNWYYDDGLVANKYYYFVHDDINYYFKAPEDGVLTLITSTPEPMLTCGDFILEYDNRTSIPSGTTKITLTQGHSYIGYGQTTLEGDGDGSAGVYVAPDGIGLGNGNFYVDEYGNLTTAGAVSMQDENGNELLSLQNGSITLSGVITWGANSSPVQVQYSDSGTGTPITNPDEWHEGYDKTNDYYASYSYDGGKTWTSAVAIRGQKGDTGATGPRGPQGEQGEPGDNANLADYGIIDVTKTQIGSNYIYSPNILGAFAVADEYRDITGYMGYAKGDTIYKNENGENIATDTKGIAMSVTSVPITSGTTLPHVIVTSRGVRMTYLNSSIYVCGNGAYVVQNGGTPQLIGGGSSGGTVVAVFG